MDYFKFMFWFNLNRKNFYSLPKIGQAHMLHKYKHYNKAGDIYMELQEYDLAIHSFLDSKQYDKIVHIYEEMGRVSNALEIAEQYKLYKLGAEICMKHENLVKAAYFYGFFDPLQAARLYKKSGRLYEAGLCYLNANKYATALTCFSKCENILQKNQGLCYLEEIAIVLYFKRQYEKAYEIFVGLNYFESALICAYALDHDLLIGETADLIDNYTSKDDIFLY
ncbi:MAG: hypothetical protein ATN35_10875 [Epulopiscium sp. Nele67-Bin004]|nr:MAG: hypothetical protein ATN35_10875 [Epulopiscium sp. Nele67-Bin004]